KTPLAAASRFLDILYKFKADNLTDEQRHLLQQACDALAMTGEVVDALLLLSTVARQSVEWQPLDMARLVGQALNQLVDLKPRTQASVQLPKTGPEASGYPPWVGEVWLNLLSNALKYSGSPPRIELGGEQNRVEARFWVRDNGKPLSDEERERVFI